MKNKGLPSPSDLHRLLDVDPESGRLTWKARNIDRGNFNGNFAGKPALDHLSKLGYKVGMIMGRHVTAHRVIWAMVYDEWPTEHIDHINHNRADNRIKNLRLASPSENARNAKLSAKNKSGFTGVYWKKREKKWEARIYLSEKLVFLGAFLSREEAILARKEANMKYGYHENHGETS